MSANLSLAHLERVYGVFVHKTYAINNNNMMHGWEGGVGGLIGTFVQEKNVKLRRKPVLPSVG